MELRGGLAHLRCHPEPLPSFFELAAGLKNLSQGHLGCHVPFHGMRADGFEIELLRLY